MAIYHLSAKCIQRSKGRSATAAAAYRSGERIRDEREGLTHDYRRRSGVEHTEIITPTGESVERAKLWNLAEAAEQRKDGTTAKEFEVALPDELTPVERCELVRDFAKYIAKAQGCAVDIAIHAPGKGDSRNHHAHFLCTTREFERGGTLGNKCAMELSDRDRKKRGLPGRRSDLEDIRATWARLANQALTRAGHVADLDHRNNQERGIMVPPDVHLGPTAAAMERCGVRTSRGDQRREIAAVRREASRLAASVEVGKRVGKALDRVTVRRMMRQLDEEQEQERRRKLKLEQRREHQVPDRKQERGGHSR